MKRKRNVQADLFERRPTTATLLPEIRVKLGILLQLLFTEAAGLSRAEDNRGIVVTEVSHEHDHG